MLTTIPRPLLEFLYLLYETDEQKTIIDGNHEAVSFAMPPQMKDLMPGFSRHALAFACNELHKEYKEDYRHTTGNDPFVAFRITACGRLWVAPGTVFNRDGSLDIVIKNSPLASYAEDFRRLCNETTRIRLHLDPDWRLPTDLTSARGSAEVAVFAALSGSSVISPIFASSRSSRTATSQTSTL